MHQLELFKLHPVAFAMFRQQVCDYGQNQSILCHSTCDKVNHL